MESQKNIWMERAASWRFHADSDEVDPFYELVSRPELLRLLPPPGNLTVEIGAGNGRFTTELQALGHRVVATDISADSVNVARARGATDVAVADAARLPLRAGIADLAVAFMCLQDLDDLRSAVGEVATVLRDGGVFCFSIVHPLRSAGTFESRDPDARFLVEQSYFDARRWDWMTTGADGAAVNLPSIHRPTAAYMEALADSGMVVERYVEPVPSDEAVRGRPWLARWQRVPCFLLVRAAKRPATSKDGHHRA